MVALSAAACEGEKAPTAPPAAEPRSHTALEPEALRFPPDDVTVPNTWATKRPIPRAVAAPQAGTLNGFIYVVGGYGSGTGIGRAVQAYQVATNTWSARSRLPSGRYGVNGVSALNGRLYVTGGFNSSSEAPTRTVYMYNPAANSWVRKADLPVAGACGAQAVIGGRLYVYAGCTRSGGHFLWRYNPANNTWVSRRAPPTRHVFPAAGVIGGKFYLAGGLVGNAGPDNLTLDVYNPATNSWVTRSPPPERLVGPASGVLNNQLYATGAGVPPTSLSVYNPATNAWANKAPMPTGRYLTAGAIANGRLFVIGGQQSSVRNEVEAYTP